MESPDARRTKARVKKSVPGPRPLLETDGAVAAMYVLAIAYLHLMTQGMESRRWKGIFENFKADNISRAFLLNSILVVITVGVSKLLHSLRRPSKYSTDASGMATIAFSAYMTCFLCYCVVGYGGGMLVSSIER